MNAQSTVRRYFFRLALCTVLSFVLVAAQPGRAVSSDEVVWKAATVTGAGFWSTKTVLWLAEQLKEKSGGRFTMEVYTGGSSGIKQPAILSAARDGLMEVFWCWGPPVASEMQVMEVQSLPAFVPGSLEMHREIAEHVTPKIAEIAEQHNIFLYFYCLAEARQIFSNKRINNMEEMKGKKIRCQGALESDFTRKLGATPVSINSADVYAALQQGVIDGAWITDAACFAYKWYEVTDYIIDRQDNGSPAGLLINRDALEKLPPDLKKLLVDLQPAFSEKLYENMFSLARKSREALEEKGMKVIAWPETDMKKKVEIGSQIWKQWYSKANKNAKELFDISKKFIEEKGAM